MAQLPEDSNSAPQKALKKADEQQLKHLEFVRVAVLHALLYFSNLYNVAKEKSGPLKSGVQTVEGTIKSVVGPVYQKFNDVPGKVIKYIDDKVDESTTGLKDNAPPVVKQVTGIACSLATEVKKAGVVDTATGLAKSVYTKYKPAANELYSKYEPVAEEYAVSTWRKLNELPMFPKVTQAVLPKAAYCTEKYNQMVQLTAEEGYKISSYLPLVPNEKIAKIFSTGSSPASDAASH